MTTNLHSCRRHNRFLEFVSSELPFSTSSTFSVSLPPTIGANLLEFYFPNDLTTASVAPSGPSLDNLSRPWFIYELHEVGKAAMIRLMDSGHRKSLKTHWAQLGDRDWLDEAEAPHRREFYERKGAQPFRIFISLS